MADGSIGNAYVTVKPKVDNNFGKAIEEKGAPAGSGFGSKFSGAAQKALSAGAVALGNILANVVSTAANAIKDFVADSIQTGMSFEKSMSQVAATMGVSVGEIQDLSTYAKEMGATTAFSATQAAEALNYMALAGYNSEQAMTMLPNVLNLAAAGNMDLARASDMVTDAQSALGLSMEQSSVMVDQMAMAASKSNTSVAQLGEAFLTVGATARGMAGGTQEMATILGVLADNGIKGAEGGTHLRNILLSLQGAAVDGVATFGDFSVAIYDAEGNMRSTVDIFKDMQAGLGEMDQASRDAILSGVFNKTDLASINALLGTSSERFDELSSAIGDAQGAAQKMADTQLDNLAGDVTLFQSALEGVQIAIFEGISPALRSIVQLGTEVMTALAAAFTDSPLTDTLSSIGEAFTSVGTQIADAFMPVFEQMAATVGENMPMIQEIVGGAMDFIGSVISSVWGVASEVIVGAMTTIAGILNDNWPLIEILITNVMSAIQAIAQDVWPALSALVSSVMTAIGTVISTVWPIIETITTTVMAAVLTVANAVWPAIAMVVTTAVDVISGIINGMSSVIGVVTGIFDSVKSAIETPMNTAKDIVRTIIDTIKGFFNFQITWPHIPLPEFIVSGSPNPLDWLEGNTPHFDIVWHKLGGFVDGATLIGAGEAGPEMILPKSGGLMTDFAEAVASQENDEELIRWLSRNLGAIIANNAPTISRRDFDRMARSAVV